MHGPIKLTFLIFFYTLSPHRIYKRVVNLAVIFVILVCVCGVFLAIFQCNPVGMWADPVGVKCFNQKAADVGFGVAVIICDFMVL